MRGIALVAALMGLGMAASAHAATAFGPQEVPPAAHMFTVGTLKLAALHDADMVVANDGKTFGVGVDPAAVGAVLRKAGAPADRIALSVNALLVHAGNRVVLIDTGLGPKVHGQLLASLRQAGVEPASVTDVLITHSHGDHVGGLVDAAGRPAFPNATIRMSAAEWDWMQQKAPPELVKAISGQVHTFQPGAAIVPGITAVSLPGHTPGQCGYEIVSGGEKLLDIGDIAHSFIVSLAKPQWTIKFDNDDATAKNTRETELKKLAGDHELIFAPHFPFPGVGHIVATDQGFAWKPAE